MSPHFDFHALAPLIVLSATIVVVLVADLLFRGRDRWQTPRIASIGVLAALVPVITLAIDGSTRRMFGGSFVVDNYSLAFQGFFLVVTYLTLLLSVDYIGEGDYYQGEYYFLVLTSVLGMLVMASARDLISIFVALETISIPTFVLAGWRKHDVRSNEASIKYYLIGVLSSAVMLYGMSFIFGFSGSTLLTDVARYARTTSDIPVLFVVAILFTLVGFAFKISAVPFHFWAPDTYEGAPTPVTAFLSVASKAGGFVALLTIVYVGFFPSVDSWQPVLWVLAALSMTVGNLIALRQTNIVRMLAYSSIAQGGFILVPLAVAGDGRAAASSLEAVVSYILIYGAMNLGAFAVVIAVSRRTRSGEISSYAGLGQLAPALAVLMTGFLFSLAGIPPLAGWYAKFMMFRAVIDAGTPAAVVLGVIAAVNSVIAFFYYAAVARQMWFREPADESARVVEIPAALGVALSLCAAVVIVVGVYPQVFGHVGELARFYDELAAGLADRIRRRGPIPFSEFVGAALDAFFAAGGAGRAGADFVTSPEVGPLFGAVVARALDGWWHELGSPDPFLVVEAGAGNGRLAREVLRAAPACVTALRMVLVERSATLRAAERDLLTIEPEEDALGPVVATGGDAEPQPVPGVGPIVASLDELPAFPFTGVILANELLDNLPFDIVERDAVGWREIRVGLAGDRFVEVAVPAPAELALAFDAPPGARLPAQVGVERWVSKSASALRRGVVCLVDYAAPAAALVARGQPGWLRTYRSHGRGTSPLDSPGSQDVTTDVVLETLRRAARAGGLTVRGQMTQAAWLDANGIAALVEEGRATWRARAHVGDLEALAARSRVTEAAALTDPDGLGAHTVVELTKGL